MSAVSPSIARSWFGTLGTSALILCFGIGTGIIAARLLGPTDRGLLAVILFWPTVLSGIGYLSMQEAVVYRRSRASTSRKAFVTTIAVVSILLSIPVVTIGFFSLEYLIGSDRAAVLPVAQAFILFFLPLNFIASGLLAVDHADRNFYRYNLLRLTSPVVYLFGLSLLWVTGTISVAAAVWASLAGTALTALVRIWTWRTEMLVLPSWREALALLHQGMLFHGATLVKLLAAQVDRIVLFIFFANAVIGQYVVALSIATAGLALITNSIHTVLFPRVAAEASREIALRQFRMALQRATVVLVLGSIVAVIIIPVLLPVLFGKAFSPAVDIAIMLVIAYVPLALRQIIMNTLRGFGDVRVGLVGESSAVGVFVLCVFPLIYFYDVQGIPIALIAANGVALAVVSISIRQIYSIRPKDWLLPSWQMVIDFTALASRLFGAAKHLR